MVSPCRFLIVGAIPHPLSLTMVSPNARVKPPLAREWDGWEVDPHTDMVSSTSASTWRSSDGARLDPRTMSWVRSSSLTLPSSSSSRQEYLMLIRRLRSKMVLRLKIWRLRRKKMRRT